MRIVAIVQARMGSTRLPGKVLMEAGGQPVLCRVIRRLRRAAMLTNVVVATTESKQDDDIVRLCEHENVSVFRGSEDDVLDRYYRAAHQFQCEGIARITSDCPLIDPRLVDQVISEFIRTNADYASNVLTRTYPRGLDCEVFSFAALRRAWEMGVEAHCREHVTPFFYEHPDLFRLTSVRGDQDYSRYRWTVDTPEDLRLIRAIFSHFGGRDDFGWRQAIDLMKRMPELQEINAHILQKPLHERAAV